MQVFLLIFVFAYFFRKYLHFYLYLHSKKLKYTSLVTTEVALAAATTSGTSTKLTTQQARTHARETFTRGTFTRATFTRATHPSSKVTTVNPAHTKNGPLDCLNYGRQCQNGGRCARVGYNYACVCSPGFRGSMCEIGGDICAGQQPCMNSGKCSSQSVSSFKCECADGFEGERCEKSRPACSNVVCEGDGVCASNVTNNDYYCICKSNRGGESFF